MTAPLLVPDNLASTGVESLCYGVFITLTIAYAALACMRRDAKAYTRHSQLPMKIGSAVLFLSVTTVKTYLYLTSSPVSIVLALDVYNDPPLRSICFL